MLSAVTSVSECTLKLSARLPISLNFAISREIALFYGWVYTWEAFFKYVSRVHIQLAHYTLFANNNENGWTDETRVERDMLWFVNVSQKTFSWNAFAKVGRLDEHKALFSPYSRIFSLAAHIRKNCCLWRIVGRSLFVKFCETQFFFVKKWFRHCLQTATNSV